MQDIWYLDGLVFSGQSVLTSSGQDAIIEADFSFPSSNIAGLTIVASAAATAPQTNSSNARMSSTTNSGVTGMLYAYNWLTGTFDFFGSGSLNTTQTSISASATEPPSDYVNPSTGEVRILVRGVRPAHVSSSSFKLSADVIEIQPS